MTRVMTTVQTGLLLFLSISSWMFRRPWFPIFRSWPAYG